MLTDDKSAFRQWDRKLIIALDYTQRRYGQAIERLKECIDRGQDTADVRPGAVSDLDTAHFGDEFCDSVKDRVRGDAPVDVHQLDKDSECILIDKAKAGSDILHRITNLKKHENSHVCRSVQVVH